MDPAHLDELAELEDSYWWHVAKRRLVMSLLSQYCPAPGRLIEGGIGSARNLIEFRDVGYDVTGFDIMDAAVKIGKDRGIDDCRQHDLGQEWPLDRGSVRAVVMLDVLEHVEDPVQVLKHASATLEDKGAIIATVPAYPWMYSEWDKRLGHYRRYTATEFRTHAKAAGLRMAWMNHWNAFTLPAAVAVRAAQKMFPRDRQAEFPRVAPITNRLLLMAATVERAWMSKFGVPAGLSLVGVMTK